MILNETYSLANDVKIPKLGLGTWFIDDDKTAEAVRNAVKLGYRLIDTAQAYGNERGVGEGVRTCGVPREELFVASKVAAELKTYGAAMESIDETLEKMGLTYLDQMIIHSPQPWNEFRVEKRYFEENKEVWRALEDAQSAGKVKVIGVSNFLKDDLENLLSGCRIKPMVNQILLHISNTDLALVDFCKAQGDSGGGLFSHCPWRGAEKPCHCGNGKEVRRVGCTAVHSLCHPAGNGGSAQNRKYGAHGKQCRRGFFHLR